VDIRELYAFVCTPTYKSSHGRNILLLYVDDMIISGDDSQCTDMAKKYLNSLFDIKNLELHCYFLGVK